MVRLELLLSVYWLFVQLFENMCMCFLLLKPSFPFFCLIFSRNQRKATKMKNEFFSFHLYLRMFLIHWILLYLLDLRLWQVLWWLILWSVLICSCRCGPCRMMAPVFSNLSVKYSAAVFLTVDVEKCQVSNKWSVIHCLIIFLQHAKRNR